MSTPTISASLSQLRFKLTGQTTTTAVWRTFAKLFAATKEMSVLPNPISKARMSRRRSNRARTASFWCLKSVQPLLRGSSRHAAATSRAVSASCRGLCACGTKLRSFRFKTRSVFYLTFVGAGLKPLVTARGALVVNCFMARPSFEPPVSGPFFGKSALPFGLN